MTDFDCGTQSLNNFLQYTAKKNLRLNLGRTFLAIEDGDIVGYYTLAGATVAPDVVPSTTSNFPIPVTLIPALAVVTFRQGGGAVGPFLLKDALIRANAASQQVASFAVTLDARDDDAKRFYIRHGFTELLDGERHLFIPMKAIEKMVQAGTRINSNTLLQHDPATTSAALSTRCMNWVLTRILNVVHRKKLILEGLPVSRETQLLRRSGV